MEQEYVEGLERIIEKIKKQDFPIVLFGVGDMAEKTVQAIESMGLRNRICYCVDNRYEQQDNWNAYKVYNPEKLLEIVGDMFVILCTYRKESSAQIRKQLDGNPYLLLFDADAFWMVYELEIRKRKISYQKLASVFYLMKYGALGKIIFPSVDVIVTECCTLNCKNCIQLIPHYEHPVNYNTELVQAGIENFARLVDSVGYVRIIGGEPFLHPDIVKICQSAVQDVFVNVGITTNGTIVPKDEVLQGLSELPITVVISDYGKYSRKKEELIQKLEQYNIPYSVLGGEYPWFSVGMPQKCGRLPEENQKIYEQCQCKRNQSILNGHLYRCNYAGAVAPFQVVEDDSFNLQTQEVSLEEMKQQLLEFENKNVYRNACDYCGIWRNLPVMVAEQEPRGRKEN